MTSGLAIKTLLSRLATQRPLRIVGPLYLCLYALGFYFAFLLRYAFDVPAIVREAFWLTISTAALIKIGVCILTGEWKLSFDSANKREMHTVFLSATVSAVAIFLINLTLFAAFDSAIARSVIAIDWVITIGTASLLRVLFAKGSEPEAGKSNWLPVSSAFVGIFVLCFGLIFCSLSYDAHLGEWFNGDALYLGHFVEDVFVDGNSWSGWMFPPAPFLVPDLFCAMAGRLVTEHAALGMFFAGAFIFLCVVLSAIYAATLTSRDQKTTLIFMTISTAIVALGIAWGGSATRLRFLLLPAYHTGTYALAFLLAGLGVHIAVDQGKNRRFLIGLFALVGFCAGFSDLMTVAFVSAPLTVALVIGWILNLIAIRRAALVAALIWAAPMVGVYCCRASLRMMPFANFSKVSIASVAKAASLVLEGLLTEFAALRPLALVGIAWILIPWIWLAVWLYQRSRSGESIESVPVTTRRKMLLLICFSLAGPASIGALVAGGNYTLLHDGYEYIFRYLHPLLYTPLLLWPILIPDSFLYKVRCAFPRMIVAEFGIAAALILMGGIAVVGIGPRPLHAYVPDYVQKLEQIAQERGLRHGVAYYWTARHVNMFASDDLRIFPINPEMRYFDWMNNRNWVMGPYRDPSLAPRPEFIVVSPTEIYTRADVIKHFGVPAEEIPLDEPGTRSVLIYNRSEDLALREMFLRPKTSWIAGFYPFETDDTKNWRWCDSKGILVLHNPTGENIEVDVKFDCATAFPERSTVSIESDFFNAELSANVQGTTIAKRITLPPGDHAVTFSTDAKRLAVPTDSRSLYFQVRNFEMSAAASHTASTDRPQRVASQIKK